MKNMRTHLIGLVVLACVVSSGPAQEQNQKFTIGDLYRAQGFLPAVTKEAFPADSADLLKNFTAFSAGIKDARVTDTGSLKFRVAEDKVTLFWGNRDNSQPPEKRVYLWSDSYDIILKVRQSQQPKSLWSLAFWSEGKAEYARKNSNKCTDIPLAGDQLKPLTFLRRVRPVSILRAPAPDGLNLVIQNAKGSEIEILSMQLVRDEYKGGWRKEFVMPTGTVWRAVATVSLETMVYLNGQEVADKTVKTPRLFSGRFQPRAIDLKPYLKPGPNCIALEVQKMRQPPMVYLQAQIVMEDGGIIKVDSDATWKWSREFPKGWTAAGFDDSQWRQVEAAKAEVGLEGMGTLIGQVKNRSHKLSIDKNIEPPAYDGYLALANPYERSLFYTDDKPVVVNVSIPRGLSGKQPVVEWEVKRFQDETAGDKNAAAGSRGTAAQFQVTGDSLVYTLELGKQARGVYTLQAKLKSGDQIIEERIPEPFVVVGKLPMKETWGDAYEQDLDLKLETKIDFTDPSDPHPWLETDGTGQAESPLVNNRPAFKAQYLAPVIVDRNGLKYRETRPTLARPAQYSYKVEFKHPGDFYLMVLEYPDNQERWMGVACSSRWRGIDTYSKIGPSVITGWKYPVTHAMQEMKWIYRPEPGPHALNLISLQKNMTAAAAGLRIYHIAGGLPALQGHQSGQRWFGLLTENTNPENTFGWTFSIKGSEALSKVSNYKESREYYYSKMASTDTQPVVQFCADLSAWLDTAEAYTKYLRFAGQNLHVIGDYQYWDRPNQITYIPCPDIATSRLLRDFRDVAVRVFRENGIAFISAVEFIQQSSMGQEPATHMNDSQVAALGADTLFLIDKEGKQSVRDWNFLHPKVEEVMLRVADEIAEKWKEQPNFLGESWLAFSGGGFAIPTFGDWADPLAASYDDATIKRFEADTGVKTPGAARDPARFSQRYEFLTAAGVKERWIQWRCEKMRDLYVKIRDRIRQKRKDLACYVPLYISVPQAMEWKNSGLPLRDYLRNAGWDIELFKNVDDLWLAHWMYAHANYKTVRKGLGYEASWEMSVGPEFYDLFNSQTRRFQMNMHHWLEVERVAFTLPMREGWAYPYQSTMQAQAGGYNANEVFTQGLIGGDPELVMFGFSHVSLIGGHEQPMREFVRVLRALPREKFNPVLDTGLKTNLAIRELKKDGKYMFYVANPGYWPIQGRIVLKAAERINDLVSGKPMPVKQEGGNAILTISLKPYGVQAFGVESSQAQVVSWQTDPVSENELAHLRGLITSGATVLHDPVMRHLLPTNTLAVVRHTVDQANNDLKAGHYAGAWAQVTDWKYWSILYNDVIAAENFDPWMAIGPAFSQKNSDGSVKYPAGPVKETGWQEIRGDGKSIPTAGYICQNPDGNWALRYAALEVYSPKKQNVAMMIAGNPASRVWVNREKIDDTFKPLSDKTNRCQLEIPLSKGWNRIVRTVDASAIDADLGVVFGQTNNVSEKPEGLAFRLPQMDLGGPQTSYRINCGGSKSYTDKKGNVWLADHDYAGWATARLGYGYLSGRPVARPNLQVEGTRDGVLYRSSLTGMDGYRFLVVPGTYTVRLHFAETFSSGKGRRVFKVLIQDEEKFDLDIFEEAGMNTALIKTVSQVVVKNGELKIDFKGITNPAAQEIAAIEVVKEN